jgi:hypothetical protein
MKKTEKELYRKIWEQDELIEKLKSGLEEVGRDIGDVTAKMRGDVTGSEVDTCGPEVIMFPPSAEIVK